MLEEFEYQGYWWLPDNPEDLIPGVLQYSPERGVSLELMGVFQLMNPLEKAITTRKPIPVGEIGRYEIINGVASGKKITLRSCQGWYSGFSMPGYHKSKFSVGLVFIGEYFKKIEDMKFNKIRIRYSYLEEWTGVFGGVMPMPKEKTPVIVKWVTPDAIQMMDGEDYSIKIEFTGLLSGWPPFPKELRIEQTNQIIIEKKAERPFEEYLDIILNIQNFLSLALMRPVYPLSVSAISDYNKEEKGGKTYNPPIDIVYRASGIRSKPEEIIPDDMLFRYHDIKGRCDIFLINWIEKTDLLGPVYGLYFAVLNQPGMYLTFKFLSLVHALEVYHSRIMDHPVFPEKEYRERRSEIFASIPNKYLTWLKQELSWSNDLKLQQRLKELVGQKELKELVSQFIGDAAKFAQKVRDTRNYLTHYNEALSKKAAQGRELALIIGQMKALLEIYLLKEVGFDWNEITTLIRNNRNYSNLVWQKQEFDRNHRKAFD